MSDAVTSPQPTHRRSRSVTSGTPDAAVELLSGELDAGHRAEQPQEPPVLRGVDGERRWPLVEGGGDELGRGVRARAEAELDERRGRAAGEAPQRVHHAALHRLADDVREQLARGVDREPVELHRAHHPADVAAREHETAVREQVLQLGDVGGGQLDVVEEHRGAHRSQELAQLLEGGPHRHVGGAERGEEGLEEVVAGQVPGREAHHPAVGGGERGVVGEVPQNRRGAHAGRRLQRDGAVRRELGQHLLDLVVAAEDRPPRAGREAHPAQDDACCGGRADGDRVAPHPVDPHPQGVAAVRQLPDGVTRDGDVGADLARPRCAMTTLRSKARLHDPR